MTDPPGARVTTSLETKDSVKARKKSPDLDPVYYGCDSTPCEIKVPRRSKFIARVEHDGFEPARIIVRSKAGLGNTAADSTVTTAASSSVLLPAVSGTGVAGATLAASLTTMGFATPLLATDALSGSLLSLYPNPVSLKLHPVGTVETKNYDLDGLTDPNQTFASRKTKP
ncbi:MAG: hypothetical protein ABJ275_03965 [Maricaulaceae bacterium]